MTAVKEIKQNSFVSPSVHAAVITRVDAQSPMSRDLTQKDARDSWQKFIDQKLLSWLSDPAQIEDECVDPPSGTIVRLAIDFAEKFRDEELPPADSVVPDANGGIVFERREGDTSEVFHIWDDGTVEYQQFCRAHLILRRTF